MATRQTKKQPIYFDHTVLYRALHCVGDDFVKADIDKELRKVLTPDEYNKVVNAFVKVIKHYQ